MQSQTDSAQIPQGQVQPARKPGRNPLRLAAILVVALAVLVGLYAALGFWVAPRVIRDQVVAQAAQRYHRPARIGQVRLNPFTLRLEARDFSLPDADGKPMIGFARLTVQISPSSLWRGLDFTEITLEQPKVRVVIRPGGRMNLMDLAPPPNAKPQPNGSPPKLQIDHLSVRQGSGEFIDLDRPVPFTKAFAPIGFSLHRFSTVKDGARFSLKATTDRGERLAWNGAFGVTPLASQGRVTLSGIKAEPLAALADDALPFAVKDGVLDVLAGYSFALDRERLSLTIDVDQAKLAGAGVRARGAALDWISAPLLTVRGVHVDVPARSVKVGQIELDQPRVTAWLDHDGVNLARLAGPPHHSVPSAATAPTAPAWNVSLADLRIHGGSATFEDRTASTPVKMAAAPVEIAVSGFALPITAPIQFEASAGLDGGGRVGAKGSVDLAKLSADLDLEATGLPLPRLQPYLDKSANLDLLSGKLGARGHLTYVGGAATFAGQAAIDDLHTVDKVLKQDLVNWRGLAFDGVNVQTRPLAIKIRTVTARAPYAKLVIGPNYVTNIQDVLSPPGAAGPAPTADAKAAPPAPRQALPVEIGMVRIRGGTLDYGDLTLTPHFAAGIQNLSGTITGLSGRQDARSTVDLTGQVDRYSPVKIAGQVNYFAARSYTDIGMSFQNMELTTLSPYSGKFAGYRIDKGKLNVDLHYNIDDQKLHAVHHVVINQLQLGEKVDSADAVKLPVKLIVALLKDKNGVIDVPIEIDGSLDDPKFKVWPVIWHIVHNLMVKVATAPFTALGHLFGGGEELSYVDFAPGSAGLDETGARKVASLAQALNDHPAVNLEVPMAADPALDRPVLAEARYQAEIAAAQAQFKAPGKAWYGKAPSAAMVRRAMLEQLYQKTFGARPEVPKPPEAKQGPKPDPDQLAVDWLEAKIRGHVTVSDQDLQQLGRDRAQAVQDALLKGGKVDPTRVFIVTAPLADAPQVRMQLTLK